MCETCPDPQAGAPRPGQRRLKLWDIDSSWHCTILGTCLTMGDLRALRAKFDIRLKAPNPTDYDIHTAMVGLASRERCIGKALHKLLDRRHGPAVTRFGQARTPEDVQRLWREALDRGDVAGGVWGAMSHPLAPESLRTAIFGEVHMLSHQVGSAARADLRRIHVLAAEKADLEDKVGRQQERLRHELAARDRTVREMQARLELETAEQRRLAHAAGAAAELNALRATVLELERLLGLDTERRRAAESAVIDACERAARLAHDRERAAIEADDLRAENRALEERLLIAMGGERAAACGDCGRPDLCGRCILYVGGRSHQIQHLRRIVEDCNGSFVHHDGGVEENVGRLQGLLGAADAVLFPVDCVSHMAHDQLKRLCKRWEKPFVPVRRSGLGAFLHALSTVPAAAPVNPGN